MVPGGTVPYGYERDGKDLVPSEAEADVVRLIFELAAETSTRTGIARVLNERGVLRRNGTPWTRRQVTATLSRAALYREGVLKYGETTGQNKSLALLSEAESVSEEMVQL